MKKWLRNYMLLALSVTVAIALVRVQPPQVAGPYSGGPEGILSAPIQDCERYDQVDDEDELRNLVAPVNHAEASMGLGIGNFGTGGSLLGSSTGSLAAGPGSQNDYSGTNIQVEGVDEQDIVKTDGEYIYSVSERQVVILKVYPPENAAVVSRIGIEGTIIGLFIENDKLVVISSSSTNTKDGLFNYYYSNNGQVKVSIYKVSDPSHPHIVRDVTIEGRFLGARMSQGHVYVITSYYVYVQSRESIRLPTLVNNGFSTVMQPPQIGFFRGYSGGNGMTNILALEIHGEGTRTAGFMTGGYGTLYVSRENIYLATISYHHVNMLTRTDHYESSMIHKIAFRHLEVNYVCSNDVPGRLLNQFSMDEWEGNLRVATTGGHVARNGATSSNNVYVLDSNLAPIGKLEGLAPGEQIHSSRFLGERAYLVTFKKVDPFFVIDLSNPGIPRVLGYLKIPGFSDYLHPYGENLVIGLGKDTIEGDGGGFAWFQGVKLSLFDVSDVEHPKEVSKYVIGDRGTDSEVLRDHKAFMFDPVRGILAFPVKLYEMDDTQSPNSSPWSRGRNVWQGAYVFSVSGENGFVLKGRVSHGAISQPYRSTPKDVRRALYIEDVLYTVSETMVMMNALSDLAEIGRVTL